MGAGTSDIIKIVVYNNSVSKLSLQFSSGSYIMHLLSGLTYVKIFSLQYSSGSLISSPKREH